MTWQPIESAPKDGTPILIYSPDAIEPGISLADWRESDDAFPGDDGAWFDAWREGGFPIDAAPTHWMPLPPPPSEAA